MAFSVETYSILRKTATQTALPVLADMSIRSNIKPACSFTEPLQVVMDNGGQRALLPIENKYQCLELNLDVLEKVDPIFFGDLRQAAFKALRLN